MKSKCEICMKESRELYENTNQRGSFWACSKCKDVRYKTQRGKNVDRSKNMDFKTNF